MITAAPVKQPVDSVDTDLPRQKADAAAGDGEENSPAGQAPPKITDFLSADRIVLDLDIGSRKRLFERIAQISSGGMVDVEADCIFKTIAERERLGSTGLGRGVAVPHARISALKTPVITLVRLKHAVDYEAPDNLLVWLAVALLVPEDANATHLKLLSVLAGCFQNQQFIESLKRCQSAVAVRQLFDQFV